MNIVLKNSIKNVFGKPFRTLLVVFAIFMCCACALLSFEFGGSITRIFTEYLGSVSRADIMIQSGGSDLSVLPEDFPECDTLSVISDSEMLYKEIENEPYFVTTDQLYIYGMDIDEAVDMEFISPMDIKPGEMYISKTFSEDYGYEVGDTIVIHDRAYNELELTIAGLFPEELKNPLLTGNCAIVDLETSTQIGCGYADINVLLVDIKDDSKIEEAKDIIKEAYPDTSTQDLFLTDSMMTLLNEIRFIFYLMFAVTFLLVIFVTSSICDRIVSERMSFIGTLRSFGMSVQGTARILLLENVLYALMGSIPAVVLYALVRDKFLSALFSTTDGMDIPIAKMHTSLLVAIVIGAVIVECVIPLKAIFKALKTSIRDIIFDNRDTEYKFSRSALVIGIICLVIAVITFIFRNNFAACILCLITAVASLACLFPRLLKLIATGIKKVADKYNKPVWGLAAVEAISRKATVGNGVLCATASAMCIVVVALANGMAGSLDSLPYDCNVVIDCTKAYKYYSYIEHLDGVTDVEPLYYSAEIFILDNEDQETYGYIFAAPEGGYEHYSGFELPETLDEGSVLIDKTYATKHNIAEGDRITLTINPDGAFPLIRSYSVAGIIENNQYMGGTECIVVSEAEYKGLFLDTPSELMITCEDPDVVADALETYGKGTYSDVKTYQELVEEQETNNQQSSVVISVIMVIAIGMTTIGMISNQLIGFEGRKKECAVMLSTAMGKGKLSGVLLGEAFITALSASAVGTVLGTVLTSALASACKNAALVVMDLKIDPVQNLVFFVLLTMVFTGTVLFPIRNLRKMKISEQIKYE